MDSSATQVQLKLKKKTTIPLLTQCIQLLWPHTLRISISQKNAQLASCDKQKGGGGQGPYQIFRTAWEKLGTLKLSSFRSREAQFWKKIEISLNYDQSAESPKW